MIKRFLHTVIQSKFFKNKAILLFGPRQSGKTTLVKSILSDLKTSYISLTGDEADVREMFQQATSTKLKSIIGGNNIVFIDEAQRIEEIGLILKLFTDQIPEVQVIATGSSAFELANKTNEPLTGRKYEFMLYPLSFAELAEHNGLLEEKRLIEHRLVFGSYPEIVTKEAEEKELLKLLSQSYLYKDLLTLEQMKKPALLEKIVKAIALQIGNEVSYYEIAQLVGADNQTVERYVELLEQAFVVFKVPALNRNVRNEIKKGKKIYFYDNGIRNSVIGNLSLFHTRNDAGALWENYLMSERMKLLHYNGIDAQRYFWRTTQQQEIDYVEDRGEKFFAYEFKWNDKKRVKFSKTFTQNYPVETTQCISPKNYEDFLNLT